MIIVGVPTTSNKSEISALLSRICGNDRFNCSTIEFTFCSFTIVSGPEIIPKNCNPLLLNSDTFVIEGSSARQVVHQVCQNTRTVLAFLPLLYLGVRQIGRGKTTKRQLSNLNFYCCPAYCYLSDYLKGF